MTTGPLRDRAWDALGRELDGELLRPGDPAHDRHRRPAIPRFADVHPAAVARCRTPADVATAVRFAAANGMDLAVRGGGHDFAGRSSTAGLQIDTGPMSRVEVRDGLVRVGAGARLGEVYAGLAAHGLALPLGCGPTVGIAGLTIGGGLGVLGRGHGLTADRLVGAEVVTADGRVLHCDRGEHPDLRWCLQGGGAPGVVTALAFAPVPEPTACAFGLQWPSTAAPSALMAWQRWAPDAADGVYAELHLDGQRVRLDGAVIDGDLAALDELVERIGVAPDVEATPALPLHAAKRWLAGRPDQEQLEHAVVTSVFVDRDWSAPAVDRLVGALAGPGRRVDLLPMGGAYNRPAPDATGFAHRRDRFLVRYEAAVPQTADALARRRARDWLDRLVADLRPHSTGRGYRNFPDVRAGVDHDGANRPRLVAVRDRYDPAGLFGR
jgi:FAD/FMN-containing dehydrogenase